MSVNHICQNLRNFHLQALRARLLASVCTLANSGNFRSLMGIILPRTCLLATELYTFRVELSNAIDQECSGSTRKPELFRIITDSKGVGFRKPAISCLVLLFQIFKIDKGYGTARNLRQAPIPLINRLNIGFDFSKLDELGRNILFLKSQ